MKNVKKLAVITTVAFALVLGIVYLRPPGPGMTRSYHPTAEQLSSRTALLMKRGDCLVLTVSPDAIGEIDAADIAANRVYAIALTGSVVAEDVDGGAAGGASLRDLSSGETAVVGDAIDGRIALFEGRGNLFGDIATYGWPSDAGCGPKTAVIWSIERAHR